MSFFARCRRPLYLLAAFLVALAIVVSTSASRFFRTPAQNPDPNHTHADFALWFNGEKFDFSAAKYMSAHETGTGFVQLSKYLHFHDGNPHVIHSHKPGLTLGMFLESLNFSRRDDCITFDDSRSFCNVEAAQWQLFVNGQPVVGIGWDYAFKDNDKLLLIFGDPTDSGGIRRATAGLTDDACLYSKTCPWRGEPPAEGCIADPDVPCSL